MGEYSNFYRPTGIFLAADETKCNAMLKTPFQRPCGRVAAVYPEGYLPVCKRHKKVQVLAGRCKYFDDEGLCKTLIKYTPPFAELCEAHRNWDGLPCYLLKLPVELRMQIFGYLLPDKPVNAWLDAPLRLDRQRCSWELLLVNKQIHAEASDILYGSQPYTMSLGRDNLVLCGGVYSHDKSDWPSIMIYNPPREGRNGVLPPMLHKIRHLRLQICLVNPGRPQRYHNWEESIDLYDLRDSAQSLVHSLQQGNSLKSLSIVLITHKTSQSWTIDEQDKILRTIIEPLRQMRNIPIVNLEGVYQIHLPHRLSYTQYFPDNIRPAEPGLFSTEGNFVLSYQHKHQKQQIPIRVTKPFLQHQGFLDLKKNFESLTTSNARAPALPKKAHEAFASFRKAYHAVEGQFTTLLPYGKDWLLHRARVCREKGDVEGITKVRQDMEEEVKRLVTMERRNIERKEKAALEALQAFDQEHGPSRKRKRRRKDGEGRG
jgi:hypothetical protein